MSSRCLKQSFPNRSDLQTISDLRIRSASGCQAAEHIIACNKLAKAKGQKASVAENGDAETPLWEEKGSIKSVFFEPKRCLALGLAFWDLPLPVISDGSIRQSHGTFGQDANMVSGEAVERSMVPCKQALPLVFPAFGAAPAPMSLESMDPQKRLLGGLTVGPCSYFKQSDPGRWARCTGRSWTTS